MNKLLKSMTTKDSCTTNGCATNSTSSSKCVDLFFTIGAMRSKRDDKSMMNKLIIMFEQAFNENPLIAMKILFWARDIRGGAGEREIFRKIANHLANTKTEVMLKNLTIIPEYGRFDDMFSLFDTPAERAAIEYLMAVLLGENEMKPLCAKWMPRLGGKVSKEDKLIANKVRVALGMSPAEYRKLLVANTNVIETAMCRKDWSSINYQHVPSLAMSRYMKAFSKNDVERFGAYVKALEKGEAKINTGAVYPYDIVRSLNAGNRDAANAQWNALPNYLEGNDENIMAMVDVSGSMTSLVSGSVSAMDIAVSLGIYVSERLEGAFKNHFITFTSKPTLQSLSGTLSDRVKQIKGPVGYDTNIEAAFTMLLDAAIKGSVPQSDMPTKILIISDMEFNNSCISGHNVSAMNMITEKYKRAGYERPSIIFWKVNTKTIENFPVKYDESGTALISGFSPSILTALLGGELDPIRMMFRVVDAPRYAKVLV